MLLALDAGKVPASTELAPQLLYLTRWCFQKTKLSILMLVPSAAGSADTVLHMQVANLQHGVLHLQLLQAALQPTTTTTPDPPIVLCLV